MDEDDAAEQQWMQEAIAAHRDALVAATPASSDPVAGAAESEAAGGTALAPRPPAPHLPAPTGSGGSLALGSDAAVTPGAGDGDSSSGAGQQAADAPSAQSTAAASTHQNTATRYAGSLEETPKRAPYAPTSTPTAPEPAEAQLTKLEQRVAALEEQNRRGQAGLRAARARCALPPLPAFRKKVSLRQALIVPPGNGSPGEHHARGAHCGCCCCLGLAATVGRRRYTAQRAQREVERVSRETQRATWRESSVRKRPPPPFPPGWHGRAEDGRWLVADFQSRGVPLRSATA